MREVTLGRQNWAIFRIHAVVLLLYAYLVAKTAQGYLRGWGGAFVLKEPYLPEIGLVLLFVLLIRYSFGKVYEADSAAAAATSPADAVDSLAAGAERPDRSTAHEWLQAFVRMRPPLSKRIERIRDEQ